MSSEIDQDLIRRYEAGDRSPELLRRLDEAAWTGFHDPWEPRPAPDPHHLEEDPMQEPIDPEAVLPFDVATIERALKQRGWHVWRHEKDILMVQFNYDRETDRETRIVFFVQGKARDIFRLYWISDRRVDAERFDQAFRLCNHWNDNYRWPRAYVEMPPTKEDEAEDTPEPESGLLVLDWQLPLGAGIHQALFDDMLGAVISAGWDFWRMAHSEHGL